MDGWMCAVSLSAALLQRRSSLLVSFAADSAPLHIHWSNETRPKSISVTRNETRLLVSVFAYETDLLSFFTIASNVLAAPNLVYESLNSALHLSPIFYVRCLNLYGL